MAFVTYTRGADWAKRGFPGGFAHEVGQDEGFSRAYHFGQTGAVAPADVTYTHEVTGEDEALFRDLLAEGGLSRDGFAVTDEAPKGRTRRRAAAQDAPAVADPSTVAVPGDAGPVVR